MSGGTDTRPATRPSWDSAPRAGRRPRALLVLAVLALVPAVLGTVLRITAPVGDAAALLASFIPYGLLGYALALVLLLVALVRGPRRRRLVILVAAVLVLAGLQLPWLAPLFVADHRPSVGPPFTLLSLNVYRGEADVDQLGAVARQADVVILLETTPDFLSRLEKPAWRARFPYALGALDQHGDTTVFSRFPLGGSQSLGRTSFQQWITTVEVPHRAPVRLIAAHPCNPFCGSGLFASDHALLRAAVRANTVYPLVVAGDLNATDDHGPLQWLRRDGMRSATDLVGAGWQPTYPANRAFPPLLPIDHVLVNQTMNATAIRTVKVTGTDHLGLLCTLTGSR